MKTANDSNKTPPVWGTAQAAFAWYPFRKDAEVLYTAHDTAEDTKKYDYIISFGPKRPNKELFESYARRLRPDGRLLLALNNKYGLKYWCGTRGGELGRPFGEIEGGDTMLSGTELRRELENAGFITQKWYYPMPDYRFAKAVYSDKKPPDRFFATISPVRPISGAGVVLREDKIFPGIIENGAFTFMCNSYIVEAAIEGGARMCPVDFAALTLYRPPERAFITAVFSDGTAKKTAVYPQGVQSLKKLAQNHEQLILRGIEAVPIKLEGNSAVMPAIEHETLWEYMQGFARDNGFDRGEFIKIFDHLRDNIVKSSELLPPGTGGYDTRLGPVLRYAYTEMIPANCFYDKEGDRLIYFDQEHALEYCPYSVPLSRALMSISYSAQLSSHPQARTLLNELIERYGLDSCWDELMKIEREFIAAQIYGTRAAEEYNAAAARTRVIIEENRTAHDSRAAALLLETGKSIGVYGYGKRGRALEEALRIQGNPPVFTADAKTGGLPKGITADIIIVTPKKNADEIAAQLRKVTMSRVVTLDEIFKEAGTEDYGR